MTSILQVYVIEHSYLLWRGKREVPKESFLCVTEQNSTCLLSKLLSSPNVSLKTWTRPGSAVGMLIIKISNLSDHVYLRIVPDMDRIVRSIFCIPPSVHAGSQQTCTSQQMMRRGYSLNCLDIFVKHKRIRQAEFSNFPSRLSSPQREVLGGLRPSIMPLLLPGTWSKGRRGTGPPCIQQVCQMKSPSPVFKKEAFLIWGRKRNEWLMHTTWINLRIIMLSDRNEAKKKVHALWYHFYKMLGNVN